MGRSSLAIARSARRFERKEIAQCQTGKKSIPSLRKEWERHLSVIALIALEIVWARFFYHLGNLQLGFQADFRYLVGFDRWEWEFLRFWMWADRRDSSSNFLLVPLHADKPRNRDSYPFVWQHCLRNSSTTFFSAPHSFCKLLKVCLMLTVSLSKGKRLQ